MELKQANNYPFPPTFAPHHSLHPQVSHPMHPRPLKFRSISYFPLKVALAKTINDLITLSLQKTMRLPELTSLLSASLDAAELALLMVSAFLPHSLPSRAAAHGNVSRCLLLGFYQPSSPPTCSPSEVSSAPPNGSHPCTCSPDLSFELQASTCHITSTQRHHVLN